MNPHASGSVRWGIAALSLLVAGLFVLGVARAGRLAPFRGPGLRPSPGSPSQWILALLGAGAWLALTGLVAATGLFARFELRPPPVVFMLVGSALVGIGIGVSPLGGRLAAGLSMPALLLAQSFRLPLELVMHQAAQEGVAPAQLTFPLGAAAGYNLDIVTGASALVLGLVALRAPVPRVLLLAWNVLGIVCLSVITAIAVLTSPFVRAFGAHSLNTWVANFPFVWLPAACVAFAIAGHIVVWRKLKLVPATMASRTPIVNGPALDARA